MRALKYVAIFMVIVLVVALLLVGYLFATAHVSIIAFGAKGTPASDMPEEFVKLKKALEEETFYGTKLHPQALGEAEEYAFITYTVRISNQCLVPIDMIEVQVVPEPTDIVQLPQEQVYSLQAKSQGDVPAVLLVPKNSHTVRELVVTYYVWGVSFTITETFTG